MFQFVAKYLEKPMLLKRKEAKNYGKKLLIEGHYEKVCFENKSGAPCHKPNF